MSDYLEHHGIKGMKWGVRRTDAQLGNDTTSGSQTSASSPKKMGLFGRIKAWREKRVAEARNAELEKHANDWADKHWIDSWNATADEWNTKNKMAKYNRRLHKAKSSDEEYRIIAEQDADFEKDVNNHLVNATNAEVARYKKERGWT